MEKPSGRKSIAAVPEFSTQIPQSATRRELGAVCEGLEAPGRDVESRSQGRGRGKGTGNGEGFTGEVADGRVGRGAGWVTLLLAVGGFAVGLRGAILEDPGEKPPKS
jgi:hypothetical protein